LVIIIAMIGLIELHLFLIKMETKLYQTAKEFFKFLNTYEADIWIRGSKAYDANGELVAEYKTNF
jgi:hypothetical protein